MKAIKQAVASDIVGNYVSPAVAVSEIHAEGVLCGSGTDLSVQEWENGQFEW